MFVTVESQGVEAVTEMAFGSPHSVKLGNTPSTKQVLYRYAEIISDSQFIRFWCTPYMCML